MTLRLLAFSAGLWAASPAPAAAGDERLELAMYYRSLGYRDLREPKSFTPSAAFIPDHGGWTRNWTEQRAYASLVYRLVDTDRLVIAPGAHIGTSLARFAANNVFIGYSEAWETQPALLWGPSLRLLLRQAPGQGAFLRLDYELFVASAPEGQETVSSLSGTATPPQDRDAFFSWTSHEVTAAVGYDWGRVTASAGLSLTAFRLDKRLTHHIDPTGSRGTALAAILALDSQASRYGYEPQTLVAPYLSLALRPWHLLSVEAALRPSAQPDVTLGLRLLF